MFSDKTLCTYIESIGVNWPNHYRIIAKYPIDAGKRVFEQKTGGRIDGRGSLGSRGPPLKRGSLRGSSSFAPKGLDR